MKEQNKITVFYLLPFDINVYTIVDIGVIFGWVWFGDGLALGAFPSSLI